MAAGGVDRLSELPDDILRRILHFAPLKEAASTTALSRRWRARVGFKKSVSVFICVFCVGQKLKHYLMKNYTYTYVLDIHVYMLGFYIRFFFGFLKN